MKKIGVCVLSFVLMMTITLIPAFATDEEENNTVNISKISMFKKNSIERYAYSMAVKNKTSYKEELKKAENDIIPTAYDEYIAYRTKGGRARNIYTNKGTLGSMIYSEARVVINRTTGRVTRVINFGAPYASINSYSSEWRGGGFNEYRTGDKSVRFSTTGQFIIHGGGFTVGNSIISVTKNFGAVTEVMTLETNIKW